MTAPFEDVEPLPRRIMPAVRGRDAKLGMVVRRPPHSMDYRYRLHQKDLPGSPNIAFGKKRKAIFVHGCFWHRQPGCTNATCPKTGAEFWSEKFGRNFARGRQAESRLADMGCKSLAVWECEIRDPETLKSRLRCFLAVRLDRPDAERMAA